MIDIDTECPGNIPHHLWPGLKAFVLTGRPVGDFLRAVISNDLKLAVAHADDESIQHLRDIVRYFYNETPGGCSGSPERYAYWVKEGGFAGIYADPREHSDHEVA